MTDPTGKPHPSAPSSIADVLERAADLIEPEGAWTQGSYARDAEGKALGDGRRKAAVSWCAVGALEKAGGDLVGDVLVAPVRAVLPKKLSLTEWNDTPGRTQSEVVSKLREASALARSEGR